MAAVEDLIRYKISHLLIISGLLMGSFLRIREFGVEGILSILLGILFPVILFFPLYRIRVIGAGDVKLFSVIGCFFPLEQTMFCIMYSFLFGAILSVGKMLYCKNLILRLQYLANYFTQCMKYQKIESYHHGVIEKKCLIPFSVPIFFSVLLKAGGIY